MTTVQVNGSDIMAVVHVVRIVGGIVTMLVVGLLIWWAVRPSRRLRDRREAGERDTADNEDLWRVLERMEDRLEVLERAMADQVETPALRAPRRNGILAPAEEGRDSGRME
jgi:hypothetical protein